MQRLFLPIIIFIISIYLVGCGSSSSNNDNINTNKESTNSDKNSINIDKVLKSKNYLKLYVEFKIFKLSPDGTKVYGIHDHTFFVTDITKVYHWLTKDEETIYQYKDIARLEIDLPEDISGNLSKPNQSLSAIEISPDGNTAYLTTYDSRHEGGKGTLIIVDISDPKNPEVIDKNRVNLYFDGIRIFPNGKYLLALTDTEGGLPTDLTVIDIQDSNKPKVVGSIKKSTLSMDSINAVFISSDSKRAYMATDNTIEVINLEEPTVPRRIKSISTGYMDALAIIVTKDRKRMYVNSEKNLKIYDIEDDNMSFIHSHEIAGDGHYDEIENLTLSDDDNTLYATCSDEGVEPNNSLVVFDISDKDKLNLKKKIAAPRDIALTYDAHNQSLSTDGKKFYTLTTWFYVMNLDIL